MKIEKKKKIAFIGPLPPPLGGVAIMNQNFQAIPYDGFEVIAFDTSAKNDREDLYASFELNSVFRNLQMGQKLDQFVLDQRPHLINIFVTSGLSILRDLYFLKRINKYRIPVIIHFHSKTQGEFALQPKRLKIIGKLFSKYAQKIIVLSNTHYEFFAPYFGSKQCTVVENFVFNKEFENNIIEKNGEFLFVGRLTEKKGFKDLLDAVKILKAKNIYCKINVIGLAASSNEENEIEQYIASHALENYFKFHGPISGKEKNKFFKTSKILLFPSHFENSPVVLKEAIAAKMAILCSDISANRNVLNSHQNHQLFKKGNVADLAEKMFQLVNHPEDNNRMCEVSAGIQDYDFTVAKEKIQKIFNCYC